MFTRILRAPMPLTIGVVLSLTFLVMDNAAFTQGELSRGQLVGRDFLTHWTAARLAEDGNFDAIYVPQQLANHLPQPVRDSGALHFFAYSPQILPALAPLSALDYHWALVAWSLGGLLAFVLAACPRSPGSGVTWILLLAPTTGLNLSFGQNGLFTAALLVGGLRLLDSRPALAGLLFGLLTIKPQLGILIPLALAAGGYWRVMIWAVLGALCLSALSLSLYGPEPWQAWFRAEPWGYARNFLETGTGAGIFMQVSPFVSARLVFDNLATAWTLQLVALLLAMAGSVWAFRYVKSPLHRASMLVTATFLASPYAHNYDMAALSLLLIPYLLQTPQTRGEQIAYLVIAAVWLIPLLCMPLAALGLPVAPLVLALFLVVSWQSQRAHKNKQITDVAER
jgi:hypothetical protein